MHPDTAQELARLRHDGFAREAANARLAAEARGPRSAKQHTTPGWRTARMATVAGSLAAVVVLADRLI